MENIEYFKFFEQAFEQMSDVAILFAFTDGHFKYLKANKSAFKMGFERSSYGKFIEEIFPEENAIELNNMLRKVQFSKKSIRYEEYLISKKMQIYGDIILTPICDSEGVCTYILAIARDITEKVEKDKNLQENTQRYQSLMINHPDAVFELDLNGNFKSINESLEKLTGYKMDELINSSYIPLMTPNSLNSTVENFQQAIKGETKRYECSIYNKNGKRLDLFVTNVPIIINGEITGIFGIARDISEIKKIEVELKESEERYRKIIELSPNPMIIHEKGKLVYLNRAGVNIIGAKTMEEVLGRSVIDFVHPDSQAIVLDRMKKLIEKKENLKETNEKLLKLDGSMFEAAVSGVPIRFRDKQAGILVIRDISEQKKYENKLHKMAFYDYLTGAANRRLFTERFDYTIKQSKRNNDKFSVMILDFDRFKWVNDNLGHDIGDELLIQFVKRVQKCIREVDTLARVGGDEFAILLPNTYSSEDIRKIAERILSYLREPWQIKEHTFITTSSIGIATYPYCGTNRNDMMKHADKALYKAKESGRNNYQHCSQSSTHLVVSMSFDEEIKRAIKNNEFYLVYQPKINITTKELECVEALIRWNHPQKGIISPNDFIPRAEESCAIVSITRWVLNEVCDQIKDWQSLDYKIVPVSLNISPKHFEDGNLIKDVMEATKRFNIRPEQLTLEVTERVMFNDIQNAKTIIEELRTLGTRISIDDFGTGFAALSYLMEFPIDFLKLDKSFVQKLPDEKNSVFIKSIIFLAHNLNLKVIAEGIETEIQEQVLSQLGCDIGQGYLFSKPLLPKQLENEFLTETPQLRISNE